MYRIQVTGYFCYCFKIALADENQKIHIWFFSADAICGVCAYMYIGPCIEATGSQCPLLCHPLPYSIIKVPLTESGAMLMAEKFQWYPCLDLLWLIGCRHESSHAWCFTWEHGSGFWSSTLSSKYSYPWIISLALLLSAKHKNLETTRIDHWTVISGGRVWLIKIRFWSFSSLAYYLHLRMV